MAIDHSLVQTDPVISAIINADNTGVLSINSVERTFTAENVPELRQALMTAIFTEAGARGRPVRVSTMDDTGASGLICSPDGDVEEDTAATEPPAPAKTPNNPAIPGLEAAAAATAVSSTPPVATVVTDPPAVSRSVPTPAADMAVGVPAVTGSRRALRDAQSFLATPTAVEPATQGLRGALNTLGLSLAPSTVERSEREDIHHVSKHFTGTRTVGFTNQKGGSGKTPSVACMAAVFGRAGASVLAWDNNETTGTLGWRTEQGDHARSALDVLADSKNLLCLTAQQADINAYVHHQGTDKFDVLRSDEDIDGTHQVSAEEVDTLHRIAAKYYRLVLMDSGNNHRAQNWNRMIDHCDQLVVPTTTMEDRAHAALLTLKGLDRRDARTAELARNAVVVISQWQPRHEGIAQKMAEDFRPYVRDVVIVPYDPALVAGPIRFAALRPQTRRAWLKASASVAQGL